MGRRRKLREHILQLLYQVEVSKNSPEETFSYYIKDEQPDKDSKEFVRQILFGVYEKQKELDSLISQFAQNWKLHRIALIDKNILRMATYEMLYLKDIPHVVSINEAVDIAKKYSTADSGKFVNGILDKIKNEVVETR